MSRKRDDHCWCRWLCVITLLIVSYGLFPCEVRADRDRPIRIGALTASWGPTPQIVGFRDGLVALGYRENEDFFLGTRFTQGDETALFTAAQELIQSGADLIFADQDSSAQAARKATTQIPIVVANVANPVSLGLVKSFSHPGENCTGVTDLEIDLGPKRLQVFREIIPSLKRVLFSYDSTQAASLAAVKSYRDAAHRLGIELIEKAVRSRKGARTALTQVQSGEVDGILQPVNLSLNIPGFMLEVSMQRLIPTMFATAFYVDQGGLASYGPDLYASGRQAARLADKIFNGVSPAEIPVETNSQILFTLNLKTAKALGLTIAPEVLFQADRIVR